MTFQDAINTCLRQKYATFSGRASRSEYWWFGLGFMLYMLAATALFFLVNGATGGFGMDRGISVLGGLIGAVAAIGYLALIVPAIAVTVRRFHDYNLSGWWVLAGLVLSALPMIGIIASIAMFVISVLKGTNGDNRFGPDPLAAQIPSDAGPIL
ncbi:MAG: DUF805 domain-containing protein [Cypionkella sp.]|nr:DUF805 domain-containing protein [Cypionkella sp.]